MNQVHFRCQDLQRYLQRQWQKLRGIILLEASASPEFSRGLSDFMLGTHTVLSPESKTDDGSQTSFEPCNRRTASLNGSMEVIDIECCVTDIVSIIDTICGNLTSLLDAGHGYRRYYVQLLEALLGLINTLKDVERQQPDAEVLRRSGTFSELKVSVSVTYALLEKVSARLQLSIFFFKIRQLTCMALDPVPEKLKAQVAETQHLRQETLKCFEINERTNQPLQVNAFKHATSHAEALYGINKMTVILDYRRSLLVSGQKVTIHVCDSQIRVLYTVRTWLNNPTSLFHSAKRLSASVECSSGKLFNIGVPGYPNKEADSRNRIALIVSGLEEAQVRSYLPLDDRTSSPRGLRKAEALLQQDEHLSSSHFSGRSRQKSAGELLVHSSGKKQQYKCEIDMSNVLLKLDSGGQTHEVRRLSVEGKKQKTKVWYKCCVEVTGEVLAIYRQAPRSRSPGRREEGMFHTLGIGNHPELRDLILSSFVAMGLNSSL